MRFPYYCTHGGRCPCCAGLASTTLHIWQSLVRYLVFARGVQDYGLLWETSRYAVFSASWFNSGYMCTFFCVVVFLAGSDAPRAVFPCLSAFRRRQQWQYTAGFTGDEAPCTVFSFPVVRPTCQVWTRRTVRRCIPCIWLSLVLYVSLEKYTIWIFLMMTSGNVPYSSYAWFDCGFMLMRHTTEAGFAGDITPRAVLSSSWAGP